MVQCYAAVQLKISVIMKQNVQNFKVGKDCRARIKDYLSIVLIVTPKKSNGTIMVLHLTFCIPYHSCLGSV